MRTIGNILWLILAGWQLALAYLLAAVVGIVFIVTIPFSIQAVKLAIYALWPFGRALVPVDPVATSPLRVIGNVVWFVIAGWWLLLAHIVTAAFLFITIIGIPFAIANLKMASAAIAPFGKEVTDMRLLREHHDAVVVGEAP